MLGENAGTTPALSVHTERLQREFCQVSFDELLQKGTQYNASSIKKY